jgi:cellular nucleic acid-binding protein
MNDKYYVGKTTNLSKRLAFHVNSGGSEWTKIHKVVMCIDVMMEDNPFDEDKITLEYMSKYGIDNVRGGSFSQITLPKEEVKVIEKMISHANDRCFTCNQKGHYASNCPSQSTTPRKDYNVVYCVKCYRCNHTEQECMHTTTISGDIIKMNT